MLYMEQIIKYVYSYGGQGQADDEDDEGDEYVGETHLLLQQKTPSLAIFKYKLSKGFLISSNISTLNNFCVPTSCVFDTLSLLPLSPSRLKIRLSNPACILLKKKRESSYLRLQLVKPSAGVEQGKENMLKLSKTRNSVRAKKNTNPQALQQTAL